MKCLKCKASASISPICTKHVFCRTCSQNMKTCEICPMFSSCQNCPNKSLNPICVVSQCQHKLCSACVIALSESNKKTCPKCSKQLNLQKLEAYLKYFQKNKKLEQTQCKNCKKKGQSKNKDYYDCKNCGYIECFIHKQPLKSCKCKCPDCFRQTKRDIYGRILDCRCITSDTYIREKSPSPYRPSSSRDVLGRHNYLQSGDRPTNDRNNQKSPLNPIGQFHQKEGLLNKQQKTSNQSKPVNRFKNYLAVPNDYQIHNPNQIKPSTPNRQVDTNRPITPRNQLISKSPVSPRNIPTKQHVFPISPGSKTTISFFPVNQPIKVQSQKQKKEHQYTIPIKQSQSEQTIKNQKNQQKKSMDPSPKIILGLWKCKECQSILESKIPKQGICNFCLISSLISNQ